MLWTLLTCMSSVTFVAMALVTAREVRAGIGGFLIAILIGVALAIGNFFWLAKFANAAEQRPRSYAEAFRERVLRVVYLGAGMWIFGAAFLSHWITTRILSLFA